MKPKTNKQVISKAQTCINKLMELHEDALGNHQTRDAFQATDPVRNAIKHLEQFITFANRYK